MPGDVSWSKNGKLAEYFPYTAFLLSARYSYKVSSGLPRPRHVAQEFIVMRALIFFTSNWKFYTLNNLYWGSLSHKTPPKGFEIFGDFLSSRLFFRIIAAPQCRFHSLRGLFQGPAVGFRCSSSLVGPSVFSGGGSLRCGQAKPSFISRLPSAFWEAGLCES